MNKKFDKALFAANDLLARNKIKDILSSSPELVVEDNPKKMGVDLIVKNKEGEVLFYIEAEIKRVWQGPFKYETVNFPSRKFKYCNLDKPTMFFMFNGDLSEYLTTTGNKIINSKTEIVRNKYVAFGEYFFKVELKDVVFNDVLAQIKELK